MRNILVASKHFWASILKGRRFAVVLLAANVLLLTLYVTGWSSIVLGQFGPQNKKRVEKHKTFLKLPIDISEAKVRDKPIKIGEDFDGDADWLKGLKLKITNKSDKPITWLSLYLVFPETRLTGPVMLDQLFVGQRSDFITKDPPLDLQPGAELEVSLESHFDSIKRLIESRGRLDSVNDLEIEVHEAMFADGTLYSGGSIWQRNPDTSSSHQWVKVTSEVGKP